MPRKIDLNTTREIVNSVKSVENKNRIKTEIAPQQQQLNDKAKELAKLLYKHHEEKWLDQDYTIHTRKIFAYDAQEIIKFIQENNFNPLYRYYHKVVGNSPTLQSLQFKKDSQGSLVYLTCQRPDVFDILPHLIKKGGVVTDTTMRECKDPKLLVELYIHGGNYECINNKLSIYKDCIKFILDLIDNQNIDTRDKKYELFNSNFLINANLDYLRKTFVQIIQSKSLALDFDSLKDIKYKLENFDLPIIKSIKANFISELEFRILAIYYQKKFCDVRVEKLDLYSFDKIIYDKYISLAKSNEYNNTTIIKYPNLYESANTLILDLLPLNILKKTINSIDDFKIWQILNNKALSGEHRDRIVHAIYKDQLIMDDLSSSLNYINLEDQISDDSPNPISCSNSKIYNNNTVMDKNSFFVVINLCQSDELNVPMLGDSPELTISSN